MSELQFQNIALKDITPDPNQPRKYYEEQAMNELTQSVRESGVLQPILVREQPDRHNKYILVCGERRYRASIAAKLKTIPAVIRDLTDEEALQLQIVENLQRKDVNPMEEAVAFKSFIEGKDWSFDDIAKRVGKSEYYVKQRIKLNSLTADFQKLLFQNKMSVATALLMAQLPEDTQTQVFDGRVDEDDLNNPNYEFQVNKYYMNSYKGDLNNATFNTEDADLVPSMGPCTICQFNSAAAKLFPDDTARCNNISCYKNKSNIAFERDLTLYSEDPSCVLITGQYNPDSETKKLMASLNGVLEYNQYEIEDAPDFPDRDDYEGDNDTEAEDEADYQRAVANYEAELEEYNEKIKSGSYIKAFIIGGNDRGKTAYIKLKKSAKISTTQNQSSNSAENKVTEDIDAEIQRLKDKEKRNKEIDGNKVWDLVKVKFLPGKYAEEMGESLTDLEVKAVAKTMYNALGWNSKDEFRKLFKIDGRSKEFPELDNVTFNRMCRYFFLSLLPPAYCTTGINDNQDASLCMEIAEQYFPGQLLEIKDDANLKAEKRIKRVEARIKELQEQKKELKASPKTAKKK